MTTLERFLNKIDKTTNPNGCWEWTASKTKAGYGIYQWSKNGQKQYFAHRYSIEHLSGLDPTGMYVCHTCDNPGCVNPAHLFLGTAKDNMDDKVAKGRQRQNPKKTIKTPMGIFDSTGAAAKAYNKSRKFIWNQMKRYPDEFEYI
jgi:HNH endonuclease